MESLKTMETMETVKNEENVDCGNLLYCKTVENEETEKTLENVEMAETIVTGETSRSNPWPREYLQRMKNTLQQCGTHCWSCPGTFSDSHRKSSLGSVGWQPSTLPTRLSEISSIPCGDPKRSQDSSNYVLRSAKLVKLANLGKSC